MTHGIETKLPTGERQHEIEQVNMLHPNRKQPDYTKPYPGKRILPGIKVVTLNPSQTGFKKY